MANEVKAMGSRLGVIVKTIDGWDIRYDHWSAQTLGRDIALDGYEATLTRIRQMAPYGVDTPQEMKSAPWLEGTLFIDMTTKRIVWAEESEGCYLPRLINALIELTWPGWTAIWSPEGTRGTLRATGADTDIIYTDHSFKDLVDFDAASDMAPWTISNETDAFSCTTENNKTITWGNYIDLENIALLGPNKMHTLVNKVIQGCNEGKPWQWNLQTHNKQPEKGIHIDYINKTINGGPSTKTTGPSTHSTHYGPDGRYIQKATTTNGTKTSPDIRCATGNKTSHNAKTHSHKPSNKA